MRNEVRVEKKGDIRDESREVDERSPSYRDSRPSDDATLYDDPEFHPSEDKPGQTKLDGGPPPEFKRDAEGKSPAGTRDDAEQGLDYLLVDWYCDKDPDNPQNWSDSKKAWVMFQTCFLTFSIYIGSSIYTSGLPGVMQEFGVSQVSAVLGLTLFVLGYGIGPMLWAPLSEVPQIGRMPVYVGTLLLFVLLQIPTALSVNYGMLMAFRFITGFVGSPILATGGATIADMYTPRARSYWMAVWGVFATMGPSVGPLIGGYAAVLVDWRFPIWVLMMFSGSALILLVLFYPETSGANILYRRARRLREATGDRRLKAQSEIDSAEMTVKDIALMVIVRPITLNFQEPIILCLNIYIGLVYALLYCWFESFPLVFQGIYRWPEQNVGLAFIGIFIGCLIVLPLYFAFLYFYQGPRYNERGEIRPEDRLPAAIIGAFLLPVSLFFFGWSSRASVPWIVPIIGSAFFSIGAMLLFNAVLNYLADAYPLYAASVLAGNDLVRSSMGAAFPLFATAMYRKLGIGWASSLLGFLAIAFIPIPIFLWIYGQRIRLASRRARHDLIS
ncbi:putative caffeine resistance protein 5 [Peniophora sp. CONT]|nr:putative caffeine resistance protein 5 [Peniophora sp. CONT]